MIDRICAEFETLRAKSGSLPDEAIKDWLAEQQSVAGQRMDEVFDEIKRRTPHEVEIQEIEDYVESGVHYPRRRKPVRCRRESRSRRFPEPPAAARHDEPMPPGLKRKYAIVGIDLGTTYSAIAYVDHQGKAQVVSNPEDQQRPIMPSAVFFEEGEALIGQTALDNAYVEPENVVQFVKRSLGERKTFNVGGQMLTPEAVSALILKKLVQFAMPAIGPIERVVITVPAFFNEKRRAATVQCGEIAGLKVEATLNEPSAALIAYGSAQRPALEGTDAEGRPITKNYVVYDLGGGHV